MSWYSPKNPGNSIRYVLSKIAGPLPMCVRKYILFVRQWDKLSDEEQRAAKKIVEKAREVL